MKKSTGEKRFYRELSIACAFMLLLAAFCLFSMKPQAVLANTEPESGVQLPILMYHGMLKDSKYQGKYVISPDRFEADLKYLTENGYETIVVQDLIEYANGTGDLPQKPIMITFDDGYYNNYLYAFPLLKQYNMKMVLAPICRYTDEYSEAEDVHANYSHCTWSHINDMRDSGLVEIQNHSYNLHGSGGARVGAKKEKGESKEAFQKTFMEDLTKAQNRIEEQTGWRPTAFAYPFGAISDGTQDMLAQMGFQASFTCESRMNTIKREPSCLFGLGRYLRPGLQSTEEYFKQLGL